MQYWILSLIILFCGIIFIYFVKDKYKNILHKIFLLSSFAAIIHPIIKSLNLGQFYKYDFEHFVFSQKIIGLVDPLNALFLSFGIIIGLLYILYKAMPSNKLILLKPEVVLGAFLLFFSALSMQNGLLFFIAYSLIYLLISLLIKTDVTKTERFKSLLLSVSVISSAVAIMLSGMFSHSFEFAKIADSLKLDLNYSCTIFMLILSAFGLTFLASDFLFGKQSDNEFTEINIFNNIFCIFCFYGLFRFIGMGAVPRLEYLWLTIALILGIAIYNTIKTFKSTQYDKIIYNANFLQKILSLLGLTMGACGYIYRIPLVSILGYSAGVVFLINFLLNNFYFIQEFDKTDSYDTSNSCYKIGLFSCCGVPLTIGFIAWILIFSALFFGIVSGNFSLKFLSIVIFCFLGLIIIFLLIKLYLLFKEKIFKFSFEFSRNLININYIVASLIVLAGIFPKPILSIIFVPVSMYVGGTKYYELFNTIKAATTCLSIYIWILIAVLCIYALIKYIKNVFLKVRH